MVQNLKQLFRRFNTEDKCREFLINQRWGGRDGVICPHCGHDKVYDVNNGKGFKCASPACYKKFSVTVGTVFQASNIPLTTWLPAVYIINSHKKGISSVQLAKDLGVTQKTSWFMLHRIREFMRDNHPQILSGTNELDEAYMGRKFRSEYKAIPPEQGAEMAKQTKHTNKLKSRGAVVGLYNRDSNVIRTQVFNARTAEAIREVATNNVKAGATIYTDEALLYTNSLKDYKRGTVNHWLKEWVRGDIHVNHVENFWSVMKRGVYGTYHQVSFKHLQAYCNEFSYRYNSRHMKDGERFYVALQNIEGRLSYKQLVHGKDTQKESSPEA
jgi:transposase-like protein